MFFVSTERMKDRIGLRDFSHFFEKELGFTSLNKEAVDKAVNEVLLEF